MAHKDDVNAALATVCREDALLAVFHDTGTFRLQPGTAIYVGEDLGIALAALRLDLLETRRLYRDMVVLDVASDAMAAHVPRAKRLHSVRVVSPCDGCGVHRVTLHYGFEDDIDVPAALTVAREQRAIAFEPRDAIYVCGEGDVRAVPEPDGVMARWRRRLYAAMAQHDARLSELLRLPPATTRTRRIAVEL